MLELGLKVLLSYLLGSVNGSLLLGWLTGRGDVRASGSGNAGGTNALRTFGWLFALGVIVIDVAKGAIPVVMIANWQLPWTTLTAGISHIWLTLACGGAAVVGHCYPVWFGFAGGKGAATAVGVLAALAPYVLLPAAGGWILIVMTTGYVGLATMTAAAIVPVAIFFSDVPARVDLLTFGLLLAFFVVYTHRENIRRLSSGTEPRTTRLMVSRRPH
jgi:glycerol-3-phosphate acyltransferase PlsY